MDWKAKRHTRMKIEAFKLLRDKLIAANLDSDQKIAINFKFK